MAVSPPFCAVCEECCLWKIQQDINILGSQSQASPSIPALRTRESWLSKVWEPFGSLFNKINVYAMREFKEYLLLHAKKYEIHEITKFKFRISEALTWEILNLEQWLGKPSKSRL
jgi:hypothetical protein